MHPRVVIESSCRRLRRVGRDHFVQQDGVNKIAAETPFDIVLEARQ
jgi:hypothetical protein